MWCGEKRTARGEIPWKSVFSVCECRVCVCVCLCVAEVGLEKKQMLFPYRDETDPLSVCRGKFEPRSKWNICVLCRVNRVSPGVPWNARNSCPRPSESVLKPFTHGTNGSSDILVLCTVYKTRVSSSCVAGNRFRTITAIDRLCVWKRGVYFP